MANYAILLSIRPQYANAIFAGDKRVELRRVCPKHMQQGTLVLIYVSSPIQAVAGAFRVDYIVKTSVEELWTLVSDKAGVTQQEFDEYYWGTSLGVGIFFTEVWRFIEPIQLQQIQEEVSDFCPPQGFRYITHRELASPAISTFVKRAKMVMEKVSLQQIA